MEKPSKQPYNNIRAWKCAYAFSFNFVSRGHGLEEIEMLDSLKAIQESDISAKIIKVNSELFAKKYRNLLMSP